MTHLDVPIFVINLPRSVERRERIVARLFTLGLNAQIFSAFDGAPLANDRKIYNGRLRRLFFGRDMSVGEVGCTYSHLALYRHMIEHNIECAFILEDDAILRDALPEALDLALQHSDCWDIVRFIKSDKVEKRSRTIPVDIGKGFKFMRCFGTPGGAYGYLLNLKAAKRLLTLNRRIWLPIDILHGQLWRTRLRTWLLTPSPVEPDFVIESTIGHERFNKLSRLHGWERCIYPTTRFLYKLFDMIAKRISFYGGWLIDKRLEQVLRK